MTVTELGRLAELLASVRRRVRAVWALDTVQATAPLVGAAAVVLVAAGWVVPWSWGAWMEWVALGLGVAALVSIVAVAVAVRLPDMTVARVADRGLGTRDAFATALQFRADAEPFGPRIRDRAVGLAEGACAGDAVPVRWRRRSLAVVSITVPAAVALAVTTSPQDEARAERRQNVALIGAVTEQIEQAADDVRRDPAAAEAVARLDELASELGRSDDLAEAEELARRSADESARAQTPEALGTRAATQGLERSLDREPLPGASADQDAARQMDSAAAGLATLAPEELAEVADRLDELADTQAAGDPAATAALESASAAVRAGDLAAAQASLGEAAVANRAASNAAASTAALGEAAAAARAASATLGARPGAGAGQGAGDGASEGSGKGQGQGAVSGAGSGQGGGGSPNGDVGGGSGSGNSPSGQGGAGQGTGSSGGRQGETPDLDTIFDPARGADGDLLVVGGGEGSGEGGTVGVGDGPTTAGASRVPVAQAVDDYREAATEAMGRSVVAPSDRELVIDYFDQLQGRR